MKAVLALAVLCGIILSVRSECKVSGCTAGTDCGTYKTYISCLDDKISDCTSDDTVKKSLQGFLDTANEYIDQHCGGCMVTMSLTTLILSLLAVYLKP